MQYPALPARNDLLADRVIPDLKLVKLAGSLTQGDDLAHEFVTRRYGGLAIPRPVLVAPEHRGACVALDVTRANARALDLDNDFARTWLRNRQFLKPVVGRSVRDDCGHRLWQWFFDGAHSCWWVLSDIFVRNAAADLHVRTISIMLRAAFRETCVKEEHFIKGRRQFDGR